MIISIHALLAESDHSPVINARIAANFYPRSPCGERRLPFRAAKLVQAFLSTLSLRRATVQGRGPQPGRRISIHALLAESDYR